MTSKFNYFQADSGEGSLENFPASSDPTSDQKVSKFGPTGSTSGIITGASTTITIGKPSQETSTISSFRSNIEPSTMSTVYLSPFADTISPVKPSFQHPSLPRRKSGLPPSPTDDPKQLSNSRDPLLLFQDLAASGGGGSLSRRNPPPPQILSSPPTRSFDPSFFSTSYPIDGRRSAEPFGSLFASTSKSGRPVSSDLSSCLEALDLQNLDLRNIDPALAAEILKEIRNGADLQPLLEKLVQAEKTRLLKRPPDVSTPTVRPKETKMVTFKDVADDAKLPDAKPSDAFM
jgi:hypothetical protein